MQFIGLFPRNIHLSTYTLIFTCNNECNFQAVDRCPEALLRTSHERFLPYRFHATHSF